MKSWMKSLAVLVLWGAFSAGVLYALLAPDSGLLFSSPGAALGVGLIGAGLCLNSRHVTARTTE